MQTSTTTALADGWIQTYTGRPFDPLSPDRAAVDIRDIAHALSLQCRFNGHCRSFYSVAEHSVRVSNALAGHPREVMLLGLLHDAAEAYLTDLPRPVKGQMPAFSALEDRVLAQVLAAFGLPGDLPPAVHHADEILLATEARDLMAAPPAPWGLTATPLPDRIIPWPPRDAERAYLRRFDDLTR